MKLKDICPQAQNRLSTARSVRWPEECRESVIRRRRSVAWNWYFRALTAELQSFFANDPSRSGKASLRLYDDDGWHVEQVELQ